MYAYDHINGIGGVTAFTGPDCTYSSGYFAAAEIGQTARYIFEAVEDNHMMLNALMSIAVPYGYKATIWEYGAFTGKSSEFHGKDSDEGRAVCQNVSQNDDMDSI